jgi:HAD superfamily hydrolase (TIGR01450 family)
VNLSTYAFSDIVKRYKVVFFDAYGVLKNSRGVITGVAETLLWLTRAGHDLYVVTNDASKSPDAMTQSYVHPEYGSLLPASRIISSGLLAKDFLRSKVRTGRVAYLGKPGSAFYIKSAGLEAIPVGNVTPEDAVQALVMLDDEGFDWFGDLNRALNLIRSSNIPVVVANTDTSYPVSGNEIAVAVGGLASMMEMILGKRFIRFGKPDTMMFSYAFACACANDSSISKSDVLMVGDTLTTDIYGANAFGIDTALVLSGNTSAENANVQISASGIVPTYVCDSILT